MFLELRRNAKAKLLQKYLRRRLAQKKTKVKMYFKCMVIRIQKFYRRRLKVKRKCATFLKKYFKAIKARRKVIKLLKITNGSSKLLRVWERVKERRSIKFLSRHSKAITIQSFFKMKAKKKVFKRMLKALAQDKLRKLLMTHLLKEMKKVAKRLRYEMNVKARTCQKNLRRLLAKKKVKKLLTLRLKNDKAKFIQKFLRRRNAQLYVLFKQIQLASVIKLQKFFRMIMAKNKLKSLRHRQEKEEVKKKKQIEKKFQKAGPKRVEKDIENYIESLFHREL